MTAKIIQFPAPFTAPSHWSGHDEYIFEILRDRGKSIKDAVAEVERDILDGKPRYPGEDVLLRQAREALARLKPKKF